jgi:hypothetical protein
MSTRRVFLPPLVGELEGSPFLKFRLYYEGPLRPTQGEPRNGQSNPLAEHKQEIRRFFHKQLKYLWGNHTYLKSYRRAPVSVDNRPIYASGAYFDHEEKDKMSLKDYIAGLFTQNNYRFVPLVCKEFSLLCSLDVLFMRRDIPGSAIQAGDLDNRIKTLIDCLRKPENGNELRGNETPRIDEDPFFCLLENDNLVSHFAVETDMLLDEEVPDASDDKSRVRLVITVELRPYLTTYFNMAFS